jgi:AAA ATPase-like protein
VAIVEGDSGTGKTRLLDELAARARLDGGAVLVARAVEADGALPGAALRALARGGLLDAPGIAAAPAPAIATFTRDDPAWATRFASAAQAAPLPLAAAFTALLREVAAERPVALMLDDAHWADDETLQALGAVVRDVARAPLLVVLSASLQPPREAVDALRARLGRDVFGAAVHLAPLDHAALVALAHWALPSLDATDLDRLARRLARDSGGLALLAVELLNALAAGVDLPEKGVAWLKPGQTLDATLPADLPDAQRAAIRVNYHRVADAGQRVLQVVAVLGDRVEPAAIARVTRLDADALADALDDLEWQRWLVSEPRGYSYLARIVRQVIERDMVTPGQRRRILEAAAAQP